MKTPPSMSLDPTVAPRKGFREAEDRVRRFWTEASASEAEGGFGVRLDHRDLKTSAGRRLVLPTQALAAAVAAEWAAQGEYLRPETMPLTRLAYTAIDRVADHHAEVAEEAVRYLGSDVLCYPADQPRALVQRQAERWGPWRDWAAERFGCPLKVGSGVSHVAQPAVALSAALARAQAQDAFRLTGLAHAAALFGSTVLAFALLEGVLTGEEAFELSRLDEALQAEQWGEDEEAAERTAALREEALVVGRWFSLLG